MRLLAISMSQQPKPDNLIQNGQRIGIDIFLKKTHSKSFFQCYLSRVKYFLETYNRSAITNPIVFVGPLYSSHIDLIFNSSFLSQGPRTCCSLLPPSSFYYLSFRFLPKFICSEEPFLTPID